MKFIFDEGLGEDLAEALSVLGQDVVHIRSITGSGASDVEVLKAVGDRGAILVSRDKRITKNKAEKEALYKNKVGAFFIVGKSLSRWDIIKLIINNWQKMIETADNSTRPFIYKIYRGGKMDRSL